MKSKNKTISDAYYLCIYQCPNFVIIFTANILAKCVQFNS